MKELRKAIESRWIEQQKHLPYKQNCSISEIKKYKTEISEIFYEVHGGVSCVMGGGSFKEYYDSGFKKVNEYYMRGVKLSLESRWTIVH